MFSPYTKSAQGNFLLEIARGEIAGHTLGINFGVNMQVGTTGTETLWDQGGNYKFLSADTPLYVSSTDPLDTAVTVTLVVLDDTYTEQTLTATTNGQNQVAFNGSAFRIVSGVVTSAVSPVGDLYIAEADTLTGGVPDTPDRIQGKVPRAMLTDGTFIDAGTPYASDNVIHNGVITVPAGKTLHLINIQVNTGKNQDVTFSGRVRRDGTEVFTNRNPIPLYQRTVDLIFNIPLPFPERTDIEFRGIAGSPDSFGAIQTHYILVDNPA